MSSNVTYKEAKPGSGVQPNHPAGRGYSLKVVDGPNGVVEVAEGEPRKKFAIVGFAASSRNLAPFDDPTYEIWTLNQLYRHVPRATRHFDIHANWREDNVEGTDHPRWLAESGIPVYMSTYEPSIPTCVNYPLQAVIEKVSGIDYFTSTVAFEVAYAIYLADLQVEAKLRKLRDAAKFEPEVAVVEAKSRAKGRRVVVVEDVERRLADREAARELLLDPFALRKWQVERYAEREIALFGIDLIVGTEFDFQKACVEFYLGLAQSRGITVRLPQACALLKQRWRYGYQTEPEGQLIKLGEVQRRNVALQKERDQLIARLHTVDGALQENGYWKDIGDLRSKGGEVVTNEAT